MPIVPFGCQGQHNLGRGKGQYFHRVPEEGEEEIAVKAVNSRVFRKPWRELYRKAKRDLRTPPDEDDRKAVFGKTERTG